MKGLIEGGENIAVRMFLLLYRCGKEVDTKSMRSMLRMAGFDGAWPEWANEDRYLTKAGAQLWLRHLFALEQSIDMSGKRVHVSDKNVHVPSLRELNEPESLTLRMAGFNPDKFRRVLAFNDLPCEFGEMCVHCNPPKGI